MKAKWKKDFLEKVRDLKESGYSWAKIKNVLKVALTPNALRKGYYRYIDSEPVEKKAPKILVFDIETAPLLSYTWGLFKQDIGLNQIEKDWHILSFAAKWIGDDHVYYEDQRNAKEIENDKPILQKLWKLLDEADIVLTQNGISFDVKKINARFIMNGMQPPSSFRHIDTARIARRNFGFTSNKLEYMTDKLCKKYKKSKHAKYFGFNLWKAVLKGDKEAWKEMEEYNKLDILSLEELYFKLAPWDNSIDFSVYTDKETMLCSCGSTSFKKNGFVFTNTSKFQRYTCSSCGAEKKAKINLFSKNKKNSLRNRE